MEIFFSPPPLHLVNQIFRKAPNFSIWGFFYFVRIRKALNFSNFLRKNRDLLIFSSRPISIGDLFGDYGKSLVQPIAFK